MSKDFTSEKCKSLLTTGKELFWKHGFKKVSIQEICKKSNVSKMTFYRFFDNKTDFAKTILGDIIDKSIEEYQEVMNQEIPFEEKVVKTILAKYQNTQDISQEFLFDLYQNPKSELVTYMTTRSNEASNLVMQGYREAQEKGEIRKDVKIEFIQYFSVKIKEMAVDPNLIGMYDSPQDAIMELTRFFFYGILNHK